MARTGWYAIRDGVIRNGGIGRLPRSAFVSPSETTADERLAMTVLLCVPGLVRQAAPTGRSYQRPSAKPAVQFSLCPSCPSCLKKQRDDREAIAKRTQIVVRRVLNGFYRRTADYADGRRYGDRWFVLLVTHGQCSWPVEPRRERLRRDGLPPLVSASISVICGSILVVPVVVWFVSIPIPIAIPTPIGPLRNEPNPSERTAE